MQIHKLLCSLEGTRPTQTSPVLRESEASRRHNGWLISTLGVVSTESERCCAGSKRWANCRPALTALVPLRRRRFSQPQRPCIEDCHFCNIRPTLTQWKSYLTKRIVRVGCELSISKQTNMWVCIKIGNVKTLKGPCWVWTSGFTLRSQLTSCLRSDVFLMNIHALGEGRQGKEFILRSKLFQNLCCVTAQLANCSIRLHAVYTSWFSTVIKSHMCTCVCVHSQYLPIILAEVACVQTSLLGFFSPIDEMTG